MISDTENKYYVYKIARIYRKDGRIFLSEDEKDSYYVVGYSSSKGKTMYSKLTLTPYAVWEESTYDELRRELCGYVACKPKEISEYSKILGPIANKKRASYREMQFIANELFSKLNHKNKVENVKLFSETCYLAYITPVKDGKLSYSNGYFKVLKSYKLKDLFTNKCYTKITDAYDIKDYDEVVTKITPLEFVADYPKNAYTNEELLKIEEKYNVRLKYERAKGPVVNNEVALEKKMIAYLDEVKKMNDQISSLNLEQKESRLRVPISYDILYEKIDNHIEIKNKFIDYINYIDFSLINTDTLKVCGIDWSDTNIKIDPQRVYNKDLSHAKFAQENLITNNFEGCNMIRTIFINPIIVI